MKTKLDHQNKWIDDVFKNIKKLEYKIIYGIENATFNEEILEKLRKDLQMHYGALDNLKKSFNSDTFFTGYIK